MSLYSHPSNARGPTYVGGRLVYPGETVTLVDPIADPPAAAPAADVPRDLQALAAGPIKAIEAVLPELTLGEIEALTVMENTDSTPRITLIDKLNAEALKRRTVPV